jgi:ABC-type transport system involved in multi-copper enzyme maturation permease subunit
MIWHIFKKDLRLLWPLAIVVAVVDWLNAGLLIFGGPFGRESTAELAFVSNGVLPAISLLGLVSMVIAVVQQDRLPGTTQDWLTRPIPRDKLIVAKMLFVALIGLGPIFVADVLLGLAEHLRVIDVVAASLTRAFVLGGMIGLPALLVGSITRTLANAVMFALAVVVVLIVELLVFTQTPARPGIGMTGYAWTIVPVLIAANVIAAALLLPLQFRWRDTNRVRWILGAYLCVLPAAAFLPWAVAFKMQQAVSERVADPAFSLSLDTAKPVAFSSLDEPLPPGLRGHASSVMVAVPIAASRQPESETWRVDHVHLRAVGAGIDESISSWNRFPLMDAYIDPVGRLAFNMPTGIFQAAREHHAEIQLTVYLTSFRRAVARAVASLDGESLDEFSVCHRGADPYDRTIRCVSTRLVGVCMIIDDPNREPPKNAGKTMALSQCGRKYAPWPLPLWRDPYDSVRVPDQPWNMTDIARASEAPDPAQSDRRIVSNYLPSAHFTRSLSFEIAAATDEPSVGVNKSVDGLGAAVRFVTPSGMVADSHGNLFIADQTDSVIRKVAPGGEVSTFAGRSREAWRADGTGVEARFDRPRAIAIDAADNLYVTEAVTGFIRKITPAGVVTTLFGGAQVGPAEVHLNGPWLVTVIDGAIYVIDRNQDQKPVLLRITPQGVVSKLAGPDSN